jgi:twinkle protein
MSDSRLLRHGPCDQCGSKDNVGIYDDGHTHCFGCEHRTYANGPRSHQEYTSNAKGTSGLTRWWTPEEGLPHRKLKPETLRLYRYGLMTSNSGTEAEVACYFDKEGNICGQKIRKPNKDFPWLGKASDAMPFGYHLDKKGKRLVVTEGEIDAMTVAEVVKGWPVWSVTNGAQGAAKSLLKALPVLENFEEVVLFFDNDEPGRKGAEETAKALCGATQIKIARLTKHKDANEAWLAGDHESVLKAIWNAQPYKPDTIVSAMDLLPRLKDTKANLSEPYPWVGLQEVTRGIRGNEIVTIVAGSGTGKSTVVRHLAHHIQKRTDDRVGGLFIEESAERTTAGVLSIELGKNAMTDPEMVSDAELEAAAKALRLDTKPLYLFDLSFETVGVEELLSQLRFMAKSLGCKRIILDHLSFIVGGIDTDNERKAIDLAMTKLRGFVKATGITLFLVVHLRRPDGNKGFDEGLEVSTNFIRGSQSIEQLSDIVLALERNKRDPILHNWVRVRVLKNRFNGKDGMIACHLEYSPDTGRLTEGVPPSDAPPMADATEDLAFLDGELNGHSSGTVDPLAPF